MTINFPENMISLIASTTRKSKAFKLFASHDISIGTIARVIGEKYACDYADWAINHNQVPSLNK